MIVGGGITGLSAAFYLKKRLESAGAPFRLSVVEKSPTFGGKIHTIEREGFVIEKGRIPSLHGSALLLIWLMILGLSMSLQVRTLRRKRPTLYVKASCTACRLA